MVRVHPPGGRYPIAPHGSTYRATREMPRIVAMTQSVEIDLVSLKLFSRRISEGLTNGTRLSTPGSARRSELIGCE